MKNKLKYLVATNVVAAALMGANPAFAIGTLADTDITNTVNVTFEVNSVPQAAPPAASVTFEVDRVIRFIVDEASGGPTQVTSGTNDQALGFTIENTSNDTLDFNLSAANDPNGSTVFGLTDNFDSVNIRYFLDSNGNGIFEPGVDITSITSIDNLVPDSPLFFFVVSNIPSLLADGDAAVLTVTATALASDGSPLADDAGVADDSLVVQNVFDLASTIGSDTDAYQIAGADLTTSPPQKYSRVVSDPINLGVNPKRIPGATIEYCVTVTNSGSVDATAVILTDDISSLPVTYVANSALVNGVGGPVDSGGAFDPFGTCVAGATAGSEAGGTVSGTIPTLAPTETRNLVFQVTIN